LAPEAEESKVDQLERVVIDSEKSSETQSDPIDNTLDITDAVTMRANSSQELNELSEMSVTHQFNSRMPNPFTLYSEGSGDGGNNEYQQAKDSKERI